MIYRLTRTFYPIARKQQKRYYTMEQCLWNAFNFLRTKQLPHATHWTRRFRMDDGWPSEFLTSARTLVRQSASVGNSERLTGRHFIDHLPLMPPTTTSWSCHQILKLLTTTTSSSRIVKMMSMRMMTIMLITLMMTICTTNNFINVKLLNKCDPIWTVVDNLDIAVRAIKRIVPVVFRHM